MLNRYIDTELYEQRTNLKVQYPYAGFTNIFFLKANCFLLHLINYDFKNKGTLQKAEVPLEAKNYFLNPSSLIKAR